MQKAENPEFVTINYTFYQEGLKESISDWTIAVYQSNKKQYARIC